MRHNSLVCLFLCAIATPVASAQTWEELQQENAQLRAQLQAFQTSVHAPNSPMQGSTTFAVDDAAPGYAELDPLRWTSHRPDGHAPIGVMGDHMHEAGEWMFSYRYMFMEMDDNRIQDHKVSDARVLQQFPIAPTQMSMEMHMIGAMYAPSDNLTLMGMVPLLNMWMDHVNRAGTRFRANSTGVGDVRATALYKLFEWDRQRIHLNLGLSFPTGSINQVDRTPLGPGTNLPYPMQLGSGTWDLLPGLTYLGQTDCYSWGAQGIVTARLGRNEWDYSFGDRLNLTAWVARRWSDWLSTSFRISGLIWGNVDGADPRLNPNMVPTANPNLRGGEAIDLSYGVNILLPEGPFEGLKGHRLALELFTPVYQSLNGPQLETDWSLIVGWQSAAF